MHGPGPDRKAHARQIAHVPDTGIDDETPDPARGERRREKLAEISGVRIGSGCDDEHVSRLALLDRHVDHPVVRRGDTHRDRGAADAGTRINRAQEWPQEPGAALRLVNGGYAVAREGIDHLGIGTANMGVHDIHGGTPERLERQFSGRLLRVG